MADEDKQHGERKEQLLRDVADIHDAFLDVMTERLPEAALREIEIYLLVVGKLVGRLEDRSKPIRQAAQETFAEAAAMVMAELRR